MLNNTFTADMLYWVTLNVAHQIASQSDRSSCSFASNWSLSSATRSLRASRAELYGTLLLVAARYDRFFVIGHRSLGLVRLRLLRFLAASLLPFGHRFLPHAHSR